jgi:D-sedoheptulose 7-phosphate isomerase
MEEIEKKVNSYFKLVIETLDKVDRKSIEAFVDLLLDTYEHNKTIIVFGNGGSGATASHICGDFLKGVSHGLEKKFRVICLNDNVPALMAIANDLSYEEIFVEQLSNFLQDGDLVLGISGSGNSSNVIKAFEYANRFGGKTVAFCGCSGGKLRNVASLSIHADINNMEVSEDVHLILAHCVKSILIDMLKGQDAEEH